MSDLKRARIGLLFVLAATVATLLSFALPSINSLVFLIAQLLLWAGAAAFVIPFYIKRRIATLDEYKCPSASGEDARRRATEALGREKETVECDVMPGGGGAPMRIDAARHGEGYDAVATVSVEQCTDELTRAIDEAFWRALTECVPEAADADVTAVFLLCVRRESPALEQFLKTGGAEADVKENYTRIRIAAAYVEEGRKLYVARPGDGEEALFGHEQARMSTMLARAIRGMGA